ncbi:hypothetical protein [Alkalimonas amylolytica]|uniref:Uncharacterized protein n=1 Tax=Alkalimonas amylolytica TaxID=152573 RepID=A0A1H4D3F8_ALKAM|nr:hypothetical protein [Alkalimonas amylolytica]SEA67131.1 hypothetical protein SAMN04488051_10548 [Alkalimonas amylolytica]
MHSNQNQHPWNKNKRKGKEQELAEKESNDKHTDQKGKTKKQSNKDGAVLGEINDD